MVKNPPAIQFSVSNNRTSDKPHWLRYCHYAKLRIRLQFRRPRFDFWVRKMPWRRDRLPTPVFLGFSCGLAGKDSTCNVGDPGSIPGLGRSSGEGKGYLLQYSGLENSMDCIVHGLTKSRTQLSDFYFHCMFSYMDVLAG